MEQKIVFVIGKGGVGKTTVSSLLGLYFYKRYKVGAYSFDPAHNLHDVIGKKTLSDNLVAQEVDFEKWKKKYLDQVKNTFKTAYAYLTAYSMLDYFDIFEQAPDADNLGMILAFDNILRTNQTRLLIFDMPPTAVALEFFRTIRRNMRWIEALINLRRKIIEKKQIISKIKLGEKQVETDIVMKRLQSLHEFYSSIEHRLNNSYFLIIRNPDKLSHLEAERIEKNLADMGLRNVFSVDNKAKTKGDNLTIREFNTSDIISTFTQIAEDNKNFFTHIESLLSL